jgi:hypothetical protein
MALVTDVKCDLCGEEYQVHDGHGGYDCLCPNCDAVPSGHWTTRLLLEAEAVCGELNEYDMLDRALALRIEKITQEIGLRRDGTFYEVYPNGKIN